VKATITADGTLVVRPKSEIEAYALARWSEANFSDWFNALASRPRLMTDCSEFSGALSPIFVHGVPQS
jgi:hypothetical protein